MNYLANAVLNYSNLIGNHSFSVLAGYEARRDQYSDVSGNAVYPYGVLTQNLSLVRTDTLNRPAGSAVVIISLSLTLRLLSSK